MVVPAGSGVALTLLAPRYGSRIGILIALLVPMYAFTRDAWGDDSPIGYAIPLVVFFSLPLLAGSAAGAVLRRLRGRRADFRLRRRSQGGEPHDTSIHAP